MVNIDLVYLVNAGNDIGMSSIANDHSFPALGVLALGTWLKNHVPDIEVVVRDGGVIGNGDIMYYDIGIVYVYDTFRGNYKYIIKPVQKTYEYIGKN